MPRQVLTEDQVEQFLNSQNSSNSRVSREWLQYPEVSALERCMQQRMSAFVLSNELFFFLLAAQSVLCIFLLLNSYSSLLMIPNCCCASAFGFG